MATKKVIAGVVLVGGLAVSIYLWSTVGMGEDQGDQTVANKLMDFTCQVCKKTFQLTVADAASNRRANGEIVCPECGAKGAQKNEPTIILGDRGFNQEQESQSEQPESTVPAKPKPGATGRKKIE